MKPRLLLSLLLLLLIPIPLTGDHSSFKHNMHLQLQAIACEPDKMLTNQCNAELESKQNPLRNFRITNHSDLVPYVKSTEQPESLVEFP